MAVDIARLPGDDGADLPTVTRERLLAKVLRSRCEDLPIDLMVGFFLTSLDVENTQEGQDKLFDSNANSYFLAVSKSWPSLTLYGGFAIEDSEMKVSYDYYDEDLQAGGIASFSVKGRQEKRFTIGLTLDILLDLNLEAGFGDMSTYSAGLMFGF